MGLLFFNQVRNDSDLNVGEYLAKLYCNEKLTNRAISQKLGVSGGTVSRLRKQHNVPIISRYARLQFNAISDIQQQVLRGIIISDGSVKKVRNLPARICFSQCSANKEFFDWCCSFLQEYISKISVKPARCSMFGQQRLNRSTSYIFRTHRHPMFNQYYFMFYDTNGHKRISSNVFNVQYFTPIMLAVWFMGDGHSTSEPRVFLSTECFTYREHVLMRKKFNQVFALQPNIHKTSQSKKYRLGFNHEDSKKFIEIVKPYIVPSMQYKILPITKKEWLQQNE